MKNERIGMNLLRNFRCLSQGCFEPIPVLAVESTRSAPLSIQCCRSGKSVGMIVVGQDFYQEYGKNSIGLVNIGSNHGVMIGSLPTHLSLSDSRAETTRYLENDYQHKIYGFASAPARYA